MFSKQKVDYTSPLDQLLERLEDTLPHSESQKKEAEKYARIFQQRDRKV